MPQSASITLITPEQRKLSRFNSCLLALSSSAEIASRVSSSYRAACSARSDLSLATAESSAACVNSFSFALTRFGQSTRRWGARTGFGSDAQ